MTKLLFGLFLILSQLAHADPAELKWGADSEGGAPYVFQDPVDPKRVIGFEVDLVEALAKELGMKSVFVQNQWDGLVPGLNRGNYDIVVNGLEITDDRKQEVLFSNAYYKTYEQLTVRKGHSEFQTLDDLEKRVVGTLKGSLAERILQRFKDKGMDIRSYDGQINGYEDLANGRLDAVLMDWPIAVYYGAAINRKLSDAGQPIGEMSYGIAFRKADTALQGKVNAALHKLRVQGTLREIYDRWGLWNDMMAKAFDDHRATTIKPTEFDAYLKAHGVKHDWKEKLAEYWEYVPLLGKGAVVTIELSLLGMILAVSLGLFLALGRVYGPKPISLLCNAYIELVRGTPLLIQLFLIFYGLPNIGIRFSPFVAAVLGLGLNYAAYEAENYRAGLFSVPRSQMEAAFALGLSRIQSLRYVIVPQAIRLVIPPVTNDFISLLKDSSLVSVITMVELTKVYGQLASTYYDYFGIGLLTAAMYFIIGLPFVRLARMAEHHFATDRKHAQIRGAHLNVSPDELADEAQMPA